ncbi:MAG: glycosyltransferase family 2 protein, partial [Flavobacteriales bacterium]|nr:glycosyltransferase family 2 protein [Flavobacteriales bacterium]
MQIKISAVIITFNEERNIERCLLSIKDIVDEIVVVDSYSKDATKSICEKYNVRFIEHPFDGHIEQKNWAKDQATNNYILSLDADEALDKDLQKSVLIAKNDWKYDSYKMNRLTNYCGKWIRHSGWYPDTKLRLFDRRKGEWGGSNPHDKYLPVEGAKIGYLKGDILHYSYYTRQEHLNQLEYFSEIASKDLYQKGKKATYFKLILNPIASFIKAYFLKMGFLDGLAGFHISRLAAYSNYLKY